MRSRLLRVWVLCWLMLVWVLLWGKASPANIIGGFAVALVITWLLPLPAVPVEGRVHPLSLLRLVVYVGYQLVLSSLQVAWLAIKPGPPPLTAVLRARLAIKSDLVLALAVNIFTIIPGSMVLEIDQERRLIYVHVIDVGNEKAVARFYRQVEQTQRLLMAAFERDADWQPSATRRRRAREYRLDHRRRDADCGRGDRDVPDPCRAEHAGPHRRAGHPGGGDDVRDRNLGGVQPGHHRHLQPHARSR